MLNAFRRRNHWLPTSTLLIGLGLTYGASLVSTSLALGVACIGLLWFYLELMTQWSFRAPSRRKPVLEEPHWNPQLQVINGVEIQSYFWRGSLDKPTLWMAHGWTASSQRMVGRLASFMNNGWNVVMFDLPNHGGSGTLSKWTAEQSCTMVIGAANALSMEEPWLFDRKVFFYGHSMGGFLGLRLSKRRDELDFGIRWAGWIFESPMTGYTEIFDETCNLLRVPRILRPALLSKTLRHVYAINGEPRLHRLSEADVPVWGLPREPVLVVQADPDERLGAVHHERLVAAMTKAGRASDLTLVKLETLRHSGAYAHEEREHIVADWLKAHSSSD